MSASTVLSEPRALTGIRAASAVCRAIPDRWLPGVERAAGRIAAATLSGRRRQVERNIARVYGTQLAPTVVRAIVHETFTSYARYWVESFRLPDTSAADIDAGVTITGFDAVTDALDAGRGVIVALPHLGGWEWAAFWLAVVHDIPVTAVAEALEPPEVSDWFLSLRASLGMEIHPLGPGAGTACIRALQQNRVVCLVCDRDLAGDGIEVPFFGERTTLPGGPATLALRTGAPLVTAATYFDGRHHRFVVDEPVEVTRHGRLRDDVTRITAELADRLEGLIREAPEQWHLLQPNWPSDRTA
jgi:KDO2-lipid IV(A) lauroyltransferase